MLRNIARRPARRRSPRRGVVLLAAVAVLAFVVLAAVALVSSARLLRDTGREAERRLQADLLLTAGFDRAVAQLARDPQYRREVWKLSAADLARSDALTAEVEIEATPGAKPQEFTVRVQATWPAGSPQAMKASDTKTIYLPAEPGG